MVTPEERDFMWNFYAPDPRMRLNLGIRRRLAPLLGNDLRRIQVAQFAAVDVHRLARAVLRRRDRHGR